MTAIINNTTMRKTNRGLVFKNLVTSCGISRAELARELNLTKMSISNIVAELLDRNIIVEQEKKILGEPHKNPISLNLSVNCPRIIGVQIQREYCRAVLSDFRLNILDSREVRFEQASLEVLKEALCRMIGELIEDGNIFGIGLGSIGPVDIISGVICNPPNFGDIVNFPVVDFLKKRFSLPVVLEHHYNCAALAELYFGSGRRADSFMYVGITKGVGMGGIVNGKLYSDFFGSVTELGHVSLDFRGRLCRCGSRGCLERYVSTDVIAEELRAVTGQKKSFREFCQMIDNSEVLRYFYGIMDYLKVALTGSVNLFRPQLIIIGDEGKYFPQACIDYLEEEVNRITMYKDWWHVKIVKSSMNNDLLLASAAMGIIEKAFQGELLFD